MSKMNETVEWEEETQFQHPRKSQENNKVKEDRKGTKRGKVLLVSKGSIPIQQMCITDDWQRAIDKPRENNYARFLDND